jgi:hydroxypyruvate isomerase
MFAELPFEERFAAASAAGFSAVEILFPYAWTHEQVACQLAEHALAQVLINLPPGDWENNERGIACLPGRRGEFEDTVARGLTYARALDCPRLHCMAGCAPEGADADVLLSTYIDNVRFAAKAAAQHDITLTIEPINNRDLPGYLLTGSDQAAQIITEVGVPSLALQYDIYHMHVMGEDIPRSLARHMRRIGHVQISDEPGRHEPGSGEIDYTLLLPLLDELGYEGWVGCEYHPAAATLDGLGWAKTYLKPKH